MPFRKTIHRTREGHFELRLSREERRLLRELPAELRSLLEGDSDDPSLRRLFPPAYDGDASAEAEYRQLMHGELLGRHREARLGALNDLRLVLGTRLGVAEELYEEEINPDDPGSAELGIYLYLTWLQEQLVEAAASQPSS